jgi:hypothetical protein
VTKQDMRDEPGKRFDRVSKGPLAPYSPLGGLQGGDNWVRNRGGEPCESVASPLEHK